MKKLNIFVTIGLTYLLIASCSNLMLEPISQISSVSFWKSEDDVRAALRGVYVRLRADAPTNFFLWGEARSEAQVNSGFGLDGVNMFVFSNTLSANNAGPTWRNLYAVIHDSNLIIKYTPDISFRSEAEKNDILAQAYITRAFVYFIMTKTWGDLPLVTEPTEGYTTDIIQRERSPITAVFELIKGDIEQALALFPNNDFPTGRNTWSKPAANALKGDVYLWTAKRLAGGSNDYITALNALEEVDNSDVELLATFANIFDYANKGNKEIIMSIYLDEAESSSAEAIFRNMYINGVNMPVNTDQATKDEVGAMGAGFIYWKIAPYIVERFSDDDQRKKGSFVEIDTYDDDGVASYYTTVPSKFRGVLIGGVRRFYNDVILYRYADVLLMKAEIKNALGEDPSEEINQIRRRAYQNNFSQYTFEYIDREANDEIILDERLFEFLLEGKYWWDLIRFGQVFNRVPSLSNQAGNENLFLFPIAESTLSLEPNVRQNPGY